MAVTMTSKDLSLKVSFPSASHRPAVCGDFGMAQLIVVMVAHDSAMTSTAMQARLVHFWLE